MSIIGIYVEIIENKCEGMVSIRDMEDDAYFIDEDNYTVIGRYSNHYCPIKKTYRP
ncbi:MAG TPA: hypothetical protein PKL96_00630 [Bacteroidales bacterium]|nr:hypothetical protein [Bacteroidales bacterium]HPS27284.1 hypothetical protein [Bacteroidales bacterium]